MAEQVREYRCGCGGFLFQSSASEGTVERVYCRKCGTRKTVHLGQQRPGSGVSSALVTPAPPAALVSARARGVG